ncbi:hypothetical protein NOJ05_19640 [Neorhizobium galegae]|uniref:hypothetical protein n=1 Tax=Neorhizobium galegae TaxID=399 RepID=UPI0021081EDC|nr:hypothetical protein [Neorhizobium galegae]MCQ1779425.1 hypothetical protein [Neorhizobium galegae]MCQ1795585.1 hypothetical protein [Neorhizobium galegae]
MFSFFKPTKPPAPKASDDDIKGAALYLRVSKLRSVKLEFFQGLLGLTDEVTQRIDESFQGFATCNRLEVDAFCASIITTAVIATDLPESETSEIVDIYLGLWSETAAKNYPCASEATLKTRMDALLLEYSRMILRAWGESPLQTMADDSVAMNLVRNVDRLANVQREEAKQTVTAVTFKAAIGEAIRITANLVEEGRTA